MKDIKYMWNGGWDISEDKMLRRFSEYGKKGYRLESMSALKFKLVKAEPEERIYAMDYQPEIGEREEYIQIFASGGWNYVCDFAGYYIFSAVPGTKEIYTDRTNLNKVIKTRTIKVVLVWVMSIVGAITAMYLNESWVGMVLALIFGGIFGFCSPWVFGLLRKAVK